MVSAFGDDDALPAGGFSGQLQRQVVGFGPGAGEHHDRERVRERRGQIFGVVQDRIVQVAGVGIEFGQLVRDGRCYSWMGVSDTGNVVVHVEVSATGPVGEPYAFAGDEVERLGVEQW